VRVPNSWVPPQTGTFGNRLHRIPVHKNKGQQFEAIFLPYLNSAYNLARWLTRNQHDAEDVVQESYLRALQAFETFQIGRDGRPWLLRIVRNTCYTWLRENRPSEIVSGIDESTDEAIDTAMDAETALIEKTGVELIRLTIQEIPLEYREVVILRELEEWSYKEIAEITGIPIGTVMSRLSRGRRELQKRLGRVPEIKR
jgi:RNA polymerase sigma-70 factor, ECF subfamily